jgi:nickel-type superoxide dismutase maturation protease
MFNFPYAIYQVTGHSMEPTLREKDFVLVKKNNPRVQFVVGDIILFLGPEEEVYIKRITAITDNQFLVHGDNPNDSIDSRDFGMIRKEQIIGKVVWY